MGRKFVYAAPAGPTNDQLCDGPVRNLPRDGQSLSAGRDWRCDRLKLDLHHIG